MGLIYPPRVSIIFKASTASARTMSNTFPTVVYETTVIDTASGYNNTTGVYTIPFTQYYRITGAFATNGSGTSYGIDNLAGLIVKQNGSSGDFCAMVRAGSTFATLILTTNGSTIVSCTAGDTLALGGYSDVSTTTATSTATQNYFEITNI